MGRLMGGQAWTTALSGLQQATGAHVVFGGPVQRGRLSLRYFAGAISDSLLDLEVDYGAGLGGKAWRERAAAAVDDYATAQHITHHYDDEVCREGIHRLVAAPVLMRGQVHGVLYAGLRCASGSGDRLLNVASAAANELALELRVDNRVRDHVAGESAARDRAERRLRQLHADLRAMRSTCSDTEIAQQIGEILSANLNSSADLPCTLTAREVDVLCLVSEGMTYRRIAGLMGLAPQTIKTYMRNIIARLHVHSRHEAVIEARSQGLIP